MRGLSPAVDGRLDLSGKSVTGGIWVNFDDEPFPEHGWDDFAVTLLCWWADETAKLFDGQEQCEFGFMDGPFVVTALVSPSGKGVARAWEGDPGVGRLAAQTAFDLQLWTKRLVVAMDTTGAVVPEKEAGYLQSLREPLARRVYPFRRHDR